MKLLHIDSSILGAHSVSRQVSAAVVEKLRQAHPDLRVLYRDLIAEPLEHLGLESLPQNYPLAGGATTSAASRRAASQKVLDEFMAADTVVIGAPMYNFTIPSQLKAWIDRIVITGKTFRYTADGSVQALTGLKRMILVLSRGGYYGPGTAAAASEHLESYLRAIFGFIGITPEIIIAEGIQMGPDHRQKAIATALQAVSDLPTI